MTGDGAQPQARVAAERLAGRVARHSVVYGATSAIQMIVAVGSVAILTRYLAPSDFGRLSVLLFGASLATITYNLGTLQGTFSWVFGAGGDDEAGDEVDDDPTSGTRDRRRALTTGVLMTAAVGLAGTVAMLATARPLADLLIGRPDDAGLVRLAATAAAATALWRLLANILRLQRRPGAYMVAAVAMGLFVLGTSWVLVATGGGLRGVMTGQALGAVAAVAVAFAFTRRELALAASLVDARGIMRRGAPLIPLVLSTQIIQLADVFLLSRFTPAAEVGLYRAASRFGSFAAHATAVLNMAWGPLRRGPLHVAVDRLEGRSDANAAIAVYFTAILAWVVSGISLVAPELVRLASSGYGGAATLIPLTTLGFGLHGIFLLAYRTSEFAGKRTWFVATSVLSAITFLAGCLVLAPAWGAIGVATATCISWSLGAAVLLTLSSLRGTPTPYPWGKLAMVMLAAGGCAVGGRLLAADVGGAGRAFVILAALALYPLLLMALGVVPRRSLAVIAGALTGSQGRSELLGGLERLDASHRALVEALLRGPATLPALAARTQLPETDVPAAVVVALRALDGEPVEKPSDADVGSYLLGAGSFADREQAAAGLWQAGADPLEVDELAGRLATLCRGRRRRPAPAPLSDLGGVAAGGGIDA